MKVGDKVIINSNIPIGTWNKSHEYTFNANMRKPGVFILECEYPRGNGFYIGDYAYDEEWLFPVPLFKVGDTVTIREDLNVRDKVPYSVSQEMEDMAGNTYTVSEVRVEERTSSGITSFGDDGCIYRLNKEAGSWSWSSPMFDLKNYKLKFKNYESRLQEQESPLRRGSGEFSSGLCCRKHKPRITVKSVSYKKVIGRG